MAWISAVPWTPRGSTGSVLSQLLHHCSTVFCCGGSNNGAKLGETKSALLLSMDRGRGSTSVESLGKGSMDHIRLRNAALDNLRPGRKKEYSPALA